MSDSETINIATNIPTRVLDDDTDQLDLIERKIEEDGTISNVHFYSDEHLFLKKLDDDIYIILLDHRLSGPDSGFEIFKKIKEKNPDTFVIILSGMNDFRIAQKYLNMHADQYVFKGDYDYLDQIICWIKEGMKTARKRIELVRLIKNELIRTQKQNHNHG
jgi:DNA-binding NtrC family response regulator